ASTKSKAMGSGLPFDRAFRDKGILVTTGNSYTVFTSVFQLVECAHLCYRDISDREVAVIGATGSTGSGIARMLSKFFGKTLIVGRDRSALGLLRVNVGREKCEIVDVEAACRRARFIVTVSGSPDYLDMRPEHFE